MLSEAIDGLDIKSDGIYVDGTTGGGGHSEEIAKRLSRGKLICLDLDDYALRTAAERLSGYKNIEFVKSNFKDMCAVLDRLSIEKIDGVILDLGVSSFQLDDADRGFSYNKPAPLDMRMDQTQKLSAYDVVNEYPEEKLSKILFEYGEEKFSRRIASFICKERQAAKIETTEQLAEIIKSAIPAAARREGGNPCKRSFQAIRIEVNAELTGLREMIASAAERLNEGGRIVIITFHSLEDRIVKKCFNELATGCICPPDFPQCVCGRTPAIKIINKKPILPSGKELSENSRSKSAKLRIAEREKGAVYYEH